jgi:hypothetical protein
LDTSRATWRNKYAKEQRDFINGVLKPGENRKQAPGKGNPHWRPAGWMEGMAYEARVSKILRERFAAQRHF